MQAWFQFLDSFYISFFFKEVIFVVEKHLTEVQRLLFYFIYIFYKNESFFNYFID